MRKSMSRMIVLTVVQAILVFSSLSLACAQSLPFAFGNTTGDLLTEKVNGDFSRFIDLPKPMAYLDVNASSVRQNSDGFIELSKILTYLGEVRVYLSAVDTKRGGDNQNQLWFRVGNNATDLSVARNIIAGNGTLFSPQAIIVGTWYKVESFNGLGGIQNTFQLAMAYSETGETWAILAYLQLEYFSSPQNGETYVGYIDNNGVAENFFTINSNAAMSALMNGTNCNRTGVYVRRINKGGPTTAPTKAPTVAPTQAPTTTPTLAPTRKACGLLGWSIFCPFTLCGIFGRWFGFCQAI